MVKPKTARVHMSRVHMSRVHMFMFSTPSSPQPHTSPSLSVLSTSPSLSVFSTQSSTPHTRHMVYPPHPLPRYCNPPLRHTCRGVPDAHPRVWTLYWSMGRRSALGRSKGSRGTASDFRRPTSDFREGHGARKLQPVFLTHAARAGAILENPPLVALTLAQLPHALPGSRPFASGAVRAMTRWGGHRWVWPPAWCHVGWAPRLAILVCAMSRATNDTRALLFGTQCIVLPERAV